MRSGREEVERVRETDRHRKRGDGALGRDRQTDKQTDRQRQRDVGGTGRQRETETERR